MQGHTVLPIDHKEFAMSNQITSIPTIDPAYWWRQLCHVLGTRLVLSGDLDSHRPVAERQLGEWIAAGITHIIDVRDEWSDELMVAEIAPTLRYTNLGVDDAGQPMEDTWFDLGVAAAIEALRDPDSRVLVHCHMGVNRGPSMAFAILLALGFNPIRALEAIVEARPIAAILYAGDALSWWHRREGTSSSVAHLDLQALDRWEQHCRPDARWVISRIRRAGGGH
jgi:dual specificity phosphatase 3